jgi:hypothetical protein
MAKAAAATTGAHRGRQSASRHYRRSGLVRPVHGRARLWTMVDARCGAGRQASAPGLSRRKTTGRLPSSADGNAIAQSTPSPLWGGIKGGGGLATISGLSHPLPASPIKGEVPFRAWTRLGLNPHVMAPNTTEELALNRRIRRASVAFAHHHLRRCKKPVGKIERFRYKPSTASDFKLGRRCMAVTFILLPPGNSRR